MEGEVEINERGCLAELRKFATSVTEAQVGMKIGFPKSKSTPSGPKTAPMPSHTVLICWAHQMRMERFSINRIYIYCI